MNGSPPTEEAPPGHPVVASEALPPPTEAPVVQAPPTEEVTAAEDAVVEEAPAADEQPASPEAEHSHHHHHNRGEPIGVMGAHVHGADQWMISYRYMYMRMEGNMAGTRSLAPQDVRDAGYMVVPTSMDMHMHMLGAMYAPIDELTFMLMAPVQQNLMHHQAGMPLGAMESDMESVGIGDMRFSGIIQLFDIEQQQILLGVGLGLPTGSIHVKAQGPTGTHRLAYPMRLGGGSVAANPSVTYTGAADIMSWGLQLSGWFPLHHNTDDYQLGNQYDGSVWAAVQPVPWLDLSLRVSARGRENISGLDADLNPMMAPPMNPNNQAFFRMEAHAGVGVRIPVEYLDQHRFAFEFGLPFYQDVSGPQLASAYQLTAGWQWTPEQ